MLPEKLAYGARFQLANDVGFEGIEIGTITDARRGDGDQGGRGEAGPHDPLRDERRPLEVPALERRPRGRDEERRGHGDVAPQREALGRGLGAAGAGGRQRRDRPTRTRGRARRRSSASGSCPLAQELKVVVGMEEVWNKFLLSPLEMARYVDEFALAVRQGLPRRRATCSSTATRRTGSARSDRGSSASTSRTSSSTAPSGSSSGRTSARATWTGRRCARPSPRSATTAGSRTEIEGGDAAYLKDVGRALRPLPGRPEAGPRASSRGASPLAGDEVSRASAADPPGELDHEDVVGGGGEEVAEVAAEARGRRGCGRPAAAASRRRRRPSRGGTPSAGPRSRAAT